MVFLKYHNKGAGKDKAWFDLTTVPFPNPIKVCKGYSIDYLYPIEEQNIIMFTCIVVNVK